MPDASIMPVPTQSSELSPEWRKAADLAAHNLGFQPMLAALSPEHWQLVPASVADRMRLRGVPLPPGWQRGLARQVGRHEVTAPLEASVSALDAKRREIAAHVACELGLGDLAGLSPKDRAAVDQQTDETIEGCATDTGENADCSDADRTMRRLLTEHRALKELQTDETNVRLAEEGEVFSQEDDA